MGAPGTIDYLRLSQVGPQNASDGAQIPQRAGSWGELIVSQHGGKYTEWVRRGYVFVAAVAAVAAVPVNTTLTNAPAIWNPADSKKIVIPLGIYLSLGAIGTPILQGFTLSYLINCGSNYATGLPVVTWTNIAPVNLLLGKGSAASTKFAGAVVTYTTQPAKLMDLGFGHHLEGAAASGQLYSGFGHDLDGKVLMPPGTLIAFGSTIATSTTYWTTIIFAELPEIVY